MSIKNPAERAEESVKKSEEAKPAEKAGLFTKEQLLSAERFRGRRDILNALLSPHKQYTVEGAEQEITKYMKGRVK